jgi:nitrite reductase (NADH) small subunit
MSPDDGWTVVARLGDFDPRGRKLVTLGNLEIALFRIGERVYAVNNRCPHRDGPLIRGFVEEGPAIRCPMHGWRYDLATGESERPARATVYPVRVDGDDVAIRVEPAEEAR